MIPIVFRIYVTIYVLYNMYDDVLHVNYGISKICSICGTLVTRGCHFYQTPQTSETEVRIECRLVLIIANKELLCNITQHLRIDTRQHSIIIITKISQGPRLRGFEDDSSSLSNRSSREWFIKVLQ